MPPIRRLVLLPLALAFFGRALAQAPDGTLPSVTAAPANLTLGAAGSQNSVDLGAIFGLPSVSGTVVQFVTILGTLNVELYNSSTPLTTANFLSYVNSGAYANTMINRSVPGFVIQGGGFTLSGNTIIQTPTNPPVPDEYGIPNTAGTLAMAKTSSPNSATDQWFFNLVDNSTTLNSQNNGGYTVFGRVLGTGMTVINAIAALPVVNLSSLGADFANTPLYNYTSGASPTAANLVLIPSISVISIYPTTPGNPSVLSFSATSSNPAAVTATVAGRSLLLTAVAPGTSTISLTATDTNGNQAAASFTVTSGFAPAFAVAPASQTVTAGSTVAFDALAGGSDTTYQWYLNSAPISGATGPRLVITGAGAPNAGAYTVAASNTYGTVTSPPATLTVVATTNNPGRLVNLSMLSDIQGSLSMGFVNGGAGTSGNESLLIRGVGPSIGPGTTFNVPGVMTDPTLSITEHGVTAPVATNTKWGSSASNISAVQAADTATGAFPLTNTASADSALVSSFAPGQYAATVQGASGDSGFALTEVYDNTGGAYTAASTRLVNLSCLTTIAAGGQINVGFVLGGATSKTILVRVSGPSIGPGTAFNVPGVMPDPTLAVTLLSSTSTVFGSNAGWGGDASITAAANAVGAFPWATSSSKDSAVLVTLQPNIPYAVTVTSASGTGGSVLVELYEVP